MSMSERDAAAILDMIKHAEALSEISAGRTPADLQGDPLFRYASERLIEIRRGRPCRVSGRKSAVPSGSMGEGDRDA